MRSVIASIIILLVIAGGAIYALRSHESREPSDQIPLDHELITITQPVFGDVVESPLSVAGEARGFWFFEGSFPIQIMDANDEIIAEGYATVAPETNWMTEDFVPFSGTIDFPTQMHGTSGTVVFKENNPSGLPENDDSFSLPIEF